MPMVLQKRVPILRLERADDARLEAKQIVANAGRVDHLSGARPPEATDHPLGGQEQSDVGASFQAVVITA